AGPRAAERVRAAGRAARERAAAIHPRRHPQVGAGRRAVPGGMEARVAFRGPRVSVHTIAVLGAGIMGRGIAYVAALGGYDTLLQDTNRDQLDRGANDISAILERGVATGKVSDTEALSARKHLRTVTSLEEAARHADLVIEAVPERIEL